MENDTVIKSYWYDIELGTLWGIEDVQIDSAVSLH